MSSIHEFLEQVLADARPGVDMDPEVRAQLLKDWENRVSELVDRRLIDAMDGESTAEFSRFLDSDPDAEAVQRFIADHVPNAQQVAIDALAEFRRRYVADNRE